LLPSDAATWIESCDMFPAAHENRARQQRAQHERAGQQLEIDVR
jgi:hypothetical protein